MNRLTLLLAALHVIPAVASDFNERFEKSLEAGDTIAQHRILEEWQKASPDDPEIYTSYLSYYFRKAEADTLNSGNQPGNTSGDIGEVHRYNHAEMEQALTLTEQGITRYPDRLDIRFGKVYALGQIGHWTEFTNEIIRTIDYGAAHDCQWRWDDNEPVYDGRDFMLESVQDYQNTLFAADADSTFSCMRRIASAVLSHWPNTVESLNDMGLAYFMEGDYPTALSWYTKAEKLAPSDIVVLENIANAHHHNGNPKQAIAYYRKIVRAAHGDTEIIRYCEDKIEEIRRHTH